MIVNIDSGKEKVKDVAKILNRKMKKIEGVKKRKRNETSCSFSPWSDGVREGGQNPQRETYTTRDQAFA